MHLQKLATGPPRADLPDFGQSPLNEAVLGVQFSAPSGYSQIRAGEVWELFKANYPHHEEHMPLAPVFEIFGGGHAVPQGNQLEFLNGPFHDRYWFLTQDRDELIQFQQDRLLHNWRKVGDGSNGYPHFEAMIEKFTGELRKFEKYIEGLAPQTLQINQCEISYVNHIHPTAALPKASDWLKFLQFDGKENEVYGLNVLFRETISKGEEEPLARLFCEVGEISHPDGRRMITFSLTVRGAPKTASLESAVAFLEDGRNTIVRKFTELTTTSAHREWGRIK